MKATPSWRVIVGLGVGLVACVSSWPKVAPQPYHRTAAIAGTEEVGADECTVCHEDVGDHAPAPEYHADCESCHGLGSLHIDSEETADIRFPADADCLACHDSRRSHLEWTGADHRRSGVMCSDCHDSHNRELNHIRIPDVGPAFGSFADDTTRLCVSCHTAVASQLVLPSHHPVYEGMLSCTDCHQPHASQSGRLGTPTELCSSCHQDYAGPWIFEHPPVAEDCGYCHTPHGAVANALLETSQPGACIGCHTIPTLAAPHDPSAFVSECSECHSAIHGSYADPQLRR